LRPGCCGESLEGVACFGEERFGIRLTALAVEPLGVFELDDGEVEGELEGAESGLGGGEGSVGAWVVAGEVGAEAVSGRIEEGRAQTGG